MTEEKLRTLVQGLTRDDLEILESGVAFAISTNASDVRQAVLIGFERRRDRFGNQSITRLSRFLKQITSEELLEMFEQGMDVFRTRTKD